LFDGELDAEIIEASRERNICNSDIKRFIRMPLLNFLKGCNFFSDKR